MDAEFWDERYRGEHQLFSGSPNGVLVAEIAGLTPGRALDVGCGEGADAIWLAEHGWQVTAVDIAPTALQRAAATDNTGRVEWQEADYNTSPPADTFGLVSVQYFPLLRQPDHAALHGLLNAVAPGGTLLFVSHDLAGLEPQPEHGFDPNDYYQPDDVAKLLDAEWTVLVNEARARSGAPATHHSIDMVLRAQRPA